MANEIRYLKFSNASGSIITGQIADPYAMTRVLYNTGPFTPATGVTLTDDIVICKCSPSMQDNMSSGDQYALQTAIKYVSFTATWTEAIHSTGNLTIGTLDTKFVPYGSQTIEQVFTGYRDNGSGGNRSMCRVIIRSDGTVRVAPICSDSTTWANYKRVMFHQMYI